MRTPEYLDSPSRVLTRSPGHPMDTEVRRLDLVFELRAIVAEHGRELALLRVEVRQLRGQTSADQAELVATVQAALGDRVFSSAELLGRALRNDGPGLRLAALLAGRSIRSIGRMLFNAVGKETTDGLILRRVGADRAGASWCVTRQ